MDHVKHHHIHRHETFHPGGQAGFASRALSLSSRQRLFPEAQHNCTPRKAAHTLCKEFTVGFLKYCTIGRMKRMSDVSHDTLSAAGSNADSAVREVI